MVEVGAEGAAGDGRLELLVGGGDQPDVDVDFAVAPHGADAALLQCAEQLHLGLVAQVADFVEEERASVGRHEGSGLVADGPREGAFDVAEELRGGQLARYRAAVDRHEGAPRALALAVNQLGDVLLARAAGAGDEHRHVGRGDEPHVFVELAGGVAAPLDVVAALHLRL